MDLDWCIVCGRHTTRGLYCGDNCQEQDDPKDPLQRHFEGQFQYQTSLSSSTSFGNNLSCSSSSSSEEEEGNGNKKKKNQWDQVSEMDCLVSFARPFGFDQREVLEKCKKERRKLSKYVIKRALPSAYHR